MRMGSKTRYRLLIVAVAAAALIIAGASAYAARSRQMLSDLTRARGVGAAALAAGDYSTALREMQRYIGSFPRDVEALYICAQAMSHVPRPGRAHLLEAARLCRRALELQPQHAGVGHELIALYRQLGLTTETTALADQLLQYDPSDAVALQAKTLALAQAGHYLPALAVANQRNEVVPLDLDFRLVTLQIMQLAGKSNADLLQSAAAVAVAIPGDARSDLVYAYALMITGDRTAALERTRAVVSREMLDPDIVVCAAQLFDGMGQFSEATRAVEHAARLNPQQRVLSLLVERQWRLGQWQQVIGSIRQRDDMDSLDSRTMALYATALIESGRTEQADAVLAALAGPHADAEAGAWLTLIPLAFGPETPDAAPYLRACDDAANVAPGNPYFCLLLAKAYQRVGEPELALEYCRRATELAPDWPAPLAERSRVLLRLGAAADALAAAQQARLRSPGDPQLVILLAVATARASTVEDTQQVEEALGLLNALGSSWQEEALPVRIALLVRLGNMDRAAKVLAQALATEPPLKRETLLAIAAISEECRLGQEDACYQLVATAHGRTCDLAYAQACTMQRRGQPIEGARLFATVPSDASAGSSLDWKLAEARYLDMIGDPFAQTLWVEIADGNPGNIAVQWGAVAARALAGDRAVRDRALSRLQEQIGPRGVAWRMARAKWLLEGSPTQEQILEAATLAGEATRIVPDELPHVLFARCLDRLGKTQLAAEQLTIAAENRREPRPASMIRGPNVWR